MRVISGTARGRKLKTIDGSAVRPTADRVKEAMFNILAPRLKGAGVLDLFAGSGALGIEAISRGAQSAVFVDNNTRALAVLRRNLENCHITDSATVIQWNIRKNLKCLNAYPQAFDLVFMDPPYHLNLVSKTLAHLLPGECLAQGAAIVAEHEPGIQFDLVDSPLVQTDARRYGGNQLSFFQLDPDRQD